MLMCTEISTKIWEKVVKLICEDTKNIDFKNAMTQLLLNDAC